MRKILLTACLSVLFCGALQAQTQVMNVFKSDGTKVTYNVADIENVLFEDAPVTLQNQYAYNSEVTDIKSVVLAPTMGGYVVSLYREEGITSFDDEEADDPLLSFWLSNEAVGADNDLSEGNVQLMVKDCKFTEPQGTLNMSFDRMKTTVTISLNVKEGAQTDAEQNVRAEYSGAFATTYQTTDELIINDAEGEEIIDEYISSVLRQLPATTGGSTVFGLGDANASTAEGFLKGQYGVQFSVSASKLNSTIDLATETGSYTFKLIDYTTGTYDENVASGTITTDEKDGMVYINLDVTMQSGQTVAFDYFEEVTDVDDLSGMIPQLVVNNQYIYYNSDGVESDQKNIVTLKYKKGTSYTTFYFITEGENVSETDTQVCPQLQLNNTLAQTSATYDLSALKDGDLFRFRFKGMDLCSPDSKYSGYCNVPDNGTLNFSVDAEGNYDIRIEVTNSYTNNNGAGGDNTKAIVSYKGAAVAK